MSDKLIHKILLYISLFLMLFTSIFLNTTNIDSENPVFSFLAFLCFFAFCTMFYGYWVLWKYKNSHWTDYAVKILGGIYVFPITITVIFGLVVVFWPILLILFIIGLFFYPDNKSFFFFWWS